MDRPTTKTDLLTAAAANYEKLNTLVSGLTEKELSMPFDFSGDEKRKKLTIRGRKEYVPEIP